MDWFEFYWITFFLILSCFPLIWDGTIADSHHLRVAIHALSWKIYVLSWKRVCFQKQQHNFVMIWWWSTWWNAKIGCDFCIFGWLYIQEIFGPLDSYPYLCRQVLADHPVLPGEADDPLPLPLPLEARHCLSVLADTFRNISTDILKCCKGAPDITIRLLLIMRSVVTPITFYPSFKKFSKVYV